MECPFCFALQVSGGTRSPLVSFPGTPSSMFGNLHPASWAPQACEGEPEGWRYLSEHARLAWSFLQRQGCIGHVPGARKSTLRVAGALPCARRQRWQQRSLLSGSWHRIRCMLWWPWSVSWGMQEVPGAARAQSRSGGSGPVNKAAVGCPAADRRTAQGPVCCTAALRQAQTGPNQAQAPQQPHRTNIPSCQRGWSQGGRAFLSSLWACQRGGPWSPSAIWSPPLPLPGTPSSMLAACSRLAGRPQACEGKHEGLGRLSVRARSAWSSLRW